jgi:hypothetical protein
VGKDRRIEGMIDTLRLARRWREARNDPELMVEALAEELVAESVSKADMRSLESRIEASLGNLQD